MTELWLFLFLVLAGIVAGIVSVISSMASLVSYPALLLAGVSPVYANMTNTAALIFTGVGSTLSSWKELRTSWRSYLRLMLVSLVGALVGSLLLVKFPGKIFERLVPFFVLFSAFLFLMSGKQASNSEVVQGRWARLLVHIGIFVSGMYTGYFGAAAGVLLLLMLSEISPDNFIVKNAFKNVIGSCGNLIALLVFALTARVYWEKAIPLAIGLFIGGYIGQRCLKYLPVKLVQKITFTFAVLLAAYLGYQAYL